MLEHQDEWAPITDADLYGPEEVVDRAPACPPLSTWTPSPKPCYTAADWEIFDFWVRQKGHSIDTAAQCAGIEVYDALVALQQRDPYFYEFMVMVGPTGKGEHSTRRRRGFHSGVGGQAKDYERPFNWADEPKPRRNVRFTSNSSPAGLDFSQQDEFEG